MLTCETVLAQAAEAEREANTIWTNIDAARDAIPCDSFGNRPLTPPGFETERKRASDLMRRARALTAEADDMRAEAAAAPSQPSPPPAPAAKRPAVPATKPVAPVETAETVAARIINSDSAVPGSALAPQGLGNGAADTVEAAVARILRA